MKNLINSKVLLTLVIFLFSNNIQAENLSVENKIIKKNNTHLFIENKGQIHDQFGKPRPDVKYMFNYNGLKVQLKNNSFSYEQYHIESDKPSKKDFIFDNYDKPNIDEVESKYNYHRVDIELVGANEDPDIIAGGKSKDYNNYYLAHLPEEGATYVHSYETITYKNIYNKIDLKFYTKENENGEIILEYDFIIHQGGNPSDILLNYKGADDLALQDERKLNISTSEGDIIENIPVSYILDENKVKCNINVTYLLNDNNISFQISDHKLLSTNTLVIDPNVIWATYYGGEGNEHSISNCIDSSYNVFITGSTGSTSSIATSGAHKGSISEYGDAFVAKFDSQGNRIWGTYFGGEKSDGGEGIESDKYNNIYNTGYTNSLSSIATAGVHQSLYGGDSDIYIVKFDSDGQRKWGTYYGDGSRESYPDLCLYKTEVIISGTTESIKNIATSGTHQYNKSGSSDAFIAKFDTSGKLIWGTYNGGESQDRGWSISVDDFGNIYQAGDTWSEGGFSAPGGYKVYNSGAQDGFISKFNSYGNRIWSTYFGEYLGEAIIDIKVSNSDDIYITAWYNNRDGAWDCQASLAKFDIDGRFKWNSILDADGWVWGSSLSVLSDEYIIISCATNSDIIYSEDRKIQIKRNNDINNNSFLCLFDNEGKILWGTYFYGTIEMYQGFLRTTMTYDLKNSIYYSGHYDNTSTVPTTSNSHQRYNGGARDVLFIKLDLSDIAFIYKISTLELNKSTFCAGDVFNIDFEITREFLDGNYFKVQLSDTNGDFSNPNNLATIYKKSFKNNIGTFKNVILPDSLPSGSGYRIRIISSSPEIIGSDNESDITIYAKPKPSIMKIQNDVCTNTSYTYYCNKEADVSNQWYIEGGLINGFDNLDSVNITWGIPGTGSLKLIQTNNIVGCIDSVEIEIAINPSPVVSLDLNKHFCINDSIYQLNEGTPFGGIYSGIGVSGDYFDPSSAGIGSHTITYTFTDSLGCSGEANSIITVYPLPETPTITEQGDSLISSADFGNQWYLEGTEIPGAIKQSYYPLQSGNYSVRVIDSIGCESEMSSEYYYEKENPVAIISAMQSIEMSEVICESISYDTIIVSNTGTAQLIITSTTFSGINASEFFFIPEFQETLIDSSDSKEFIVEFKPKSPGDKSAKIVFSSNAVNTTDFEIDISAKKDSVGFMLSDKMIEFVDVQENTQLEKTSTITNTGTLPITWTVPIDINEFRIKDISPITTPANMGTSEMTVEFKGGGASSSCSQTYTMIEGICNRSEEMILLATVEQGVQPYAVLQVGSDSARVGETVSIPIYLRNAVNIEYSEAENFTADLLFNTTLLSPLDFPEKNIVGGIRRISLTLPVEAIHDSTLADIRFAVGLGNSEWSSLNLENVEAVGGNVIIDTVNGSFKLISICREGGDRLLNTNAGNVGINIVKPNPSSESIEIEYELIEEGRTQILIYNIFGEKVKTVFDAEAQLGRKIQTISIRELSTGSYFIVLKTPGYVLSKLFVKID
ncbi:T9SS type A sorting domain-containing protein [Bacteroidota bacterium]